MYVQLSQLNRPDRQASRGGFGRSVVAVVAMALAIAGAATTKAQQLSSDFVVQANFTGIESIGSNVGDVTQMAFGPDGKLYVATFTGGIKRYDYDPAGGLTNPVTVWSRPNDFANGQYNGSLGIAFHEDSILGTVMYLAPAVSSNFVVADQRIQSIIRLTDDDGDGNWGESAGGEVNQAIVNNLRVTDLHQVNQFLVEGDTLYVGIGSRTRTGGERSELSGAPNTDDGEFAYTGSINWIRDLSQLSSDTTTANLAGHAIAQHHLDTQPFTSDDVGKLTVYSTGFRNVFGLAMDSSGQLWASMNQNEDPLKPDELHRSDFQDDHNFPKRNEVSGNWKTNAAATAAGFFQTTKGPVALLGDHASANGMSFTDSNGAFADHPFIVRYAAGDDLLSIDPDTGAVQTIVTGLSNPIDVLTDPAGNLLVGQHGSGGRIFRVGLVEGPGVVYGDLTSDGFIDAADWAALRDNFNADLSGLTRPEAWAKGDLNGDFLNNVIDFGLFKTAYDEAHGDGALAALVPEPTSLMIALVAGGALLRRRPRAACSF